MEPDRVDGRSDHRSLSDGAEEARGAGDRERAAESTSFLRNLPRTKRQRKRKRWDTVECHGGLNVVTEKIAQLEQETQPPMAEE